MAATSVSVEKPRPRSLNPQAAGLVVVVMGWGVNLAIWGAVCLRLTVTHTPRRSELVASQGFPEDPVLCARTN